MVIGINISHNSSACVIDPAGKIVFCSSEERFSRIKNDSGFPELVLNYIFQNLISAESVEVVAVGDLCQASFTTDRFAQFMYLDSTSKRDKIFRSFFSLLKLVFWEKSSGLWLKKNKNFQYLVKNRVSTLMPKAKVLFFDHHLCHASSAFYGSHFDQALVVSLDGEGDELSGIVCEASSGGLRLISKLPSRSSVGTYYKSITALLGYLPGRHEGKITGLAAFGDSRRFYSQFKKILFTCEHPEGHCTIRSVCAETMGDRYVLTSISNNLFFLGLAHLTDYFRARKKGWDEYRRVSLQRFFKNFFCEKLELDIQKMTSFQDRADLAASCQAVLEDVVVEYIQYYLQKGTSRDLALAGGVFSNVRLNQKILERTGAQEIVIHPAMGDEGLALGAAKLYYHTKNMQSPISLKTAFLGAAYTDSDQIQNALKKNGLFGKEMEKTQLAFEIATALTQGKIVGIARGAAEYGPRALGNRSILISPTVREINDSINKRLNRTEFMPFAPMVLEEVFAEIFDSPSLEGARNAAQFMTITLNVREEWKSIIPAVVHLDGTARPQIVSEQSNELCYLVLKEFQRRTGIGVLVNTSFNMHEEPIVNTPLDAIRSFKSGAVDLLIIENFLCQANNFYET